MKPSMSAAMISGLSCKLENADSLADQYGLFDAIEKLAKREKNALRGTVERKPNTPLWYGEVYVLHVLRKPDHASIKYSKVVADLEPLVDAKEFALIKAAHTIRSDSFTLRPEVKRA